jgi:hypothetical protein
MQFDVEHRTPTTFSPPGYFALFTLISDRVVRIEEIRNDPVGKGLGIGAGVGAGLTLLAIAGCDQLNYDVSLSPS